MHGPHHGDASGRHPCRQECAVEGDALVAQVEDLTRAEMEAFNETVTDVEGVYYASWAGHSCGALELLCQQAHNGEVIDPIFATTHAFLTQVEGDNDGLSSVTSSQWGEYMGPIDADHMDQVGQIGDLVNLSFDHKAFFVDEVRRLASLGL